MFCLANISSVFQKYVKIQKLDPLEIMFQVDFYDPDVEIQLYADDAVKLVNKLR